jgi:hypothetical protein
MVAVMALCLGMSNGHHNVSGFANNITAWLLDRWLFRLYDWSHRCDIPHFISRRKPIFFRYLGSALARLEPRSHGQYLVRCAIMDRWHLRVSHDPSYLEQLAQRRFNSLLWEAHV